MRGRLLIATATSIAAIACAFAALAATPIPGADESPAGRIFLTCSGAMSTAGLPDSRDPGGRIVANGVVDLESLRVAGFGIGAQPVVLVTPEIVAFGTAAAAGDDRAIVKVADKAGRGGEPAGTVVEGSFDRNSGAITVVVRSAADRSGVVLAMALQCTSGPAPR